MHACMHAFPVKKDMWGKKPNGQLESEPLARCCPFDSIDCASTDSDGAYTMVGLEAVENGTVA
jgi:hypothetical protein